LWCSNGHAAKQGKESRFSVLLSLVWILVAIVSHEVRRRSSVFESIVDNILSIEYNNSAMDAREGDGIGELRLAPVEHSPLADKVYESLRQAIMSGKLVPGERLLEAKLAEEIGVSRAPVREAINRLEMEGLIDLLPRRGSYVSTLSEEDAWEVYTLRAALEGLAYGLAKEHISEDGFAKLQAIVDRMKQCVEEGDREGLSELDTAFHRTVVELVGHARLQAVWMSINSQIALLSQRVIRKDYPDIAIIHQRHAALLDHLRHSSGEDAARAIRDHIESAADRLVFHSETREES
jgi:DNA-binding GntR family transcriptional regulator